MNEQTKEIIWNLVNSLLAAGLVFLGAFTAGNIDQKAIIAAAIAAAIVFCTKFRDYVSTEIQDMKGKKGSLFTFIGA